MCSFMIAILYCILQLSAVADSNDAGHYIILIPTVIHEKSQTSIGLSTVGYENEEQFEFILHKEELDGKLGEIQKVDVSQQDDTRLIKLTVKELENEPYQFTIHAPGESVQKTKVKALKRPGVLFIQTDKPLYKPGDTVKFRVLVLDHLTRPIETLQSINVQLKDSNGNLIRQWSYARLQRGVFQSHIDLANFVPLGNWSLKVSATDDVEETKTFNVVEYVLPLHEIHISTSKKVEIKDKTLMLIIAAKYTFGKPIRGNVSLAFDGIDYPHKSEINGRAMIEIALSDIVNVEDFSEDVYQLNVNVKIEESVSGQTYEASETIMIYNRFYHITLRKSAEYLLNDEPIWLWLTLTDPNGMPLENPGMVTVNVTRVMRFWFNKHHSLEKEPDEEGVVGLKIDSSNTTDRIELQILFDGEVTRFEILREEDFEDSPEAFFKASLLVQKQTLNSPVDVLVQSSFRINFIFYYVVSQGEIMSSGKIVGNSRRTVSFNFAATSPMVPEASLVIFTINEAKLWTDIVTFKVHELSNSVDVEISSNNTQARAQISLTVKSKPGSTIGLLAMDKSLVQLGTGNDITQQFVFQTLSELKTVSGVELERLGFTVLTNARGHSDVVRIEPVLSMMSSFAILAPRFSEDDSLYNMPDQGAHIIRKHFPETWLWTEMIPVDDKGHLNLTDIVPDTITSWSVSAFAINTKHGLGVTKNPVALTVLKSFFVIVNLPYSIVKMETAIVEVFVHNYLEQIQSVTVRVQNEHEAFQFVDETERIISILEDSQIVTVANNSVQKVTFRLKATQSGNPIITILADSQMATDAVQRNLRVTPGGLQYFENTARFIEVQNSSMSYRPFKLVIPRTATDGSVSITFSVEGFLLGAALTNLDSIIRLPSGCGEQNMLNLVPSVIALEYMSDTDTLTDAIKAKAIDYLQKGYQNQLNYKLRDGSFSVFGQSDGKGSVFLTALVAKVFTFAEKHITIDNDITSNAFNWLSRKQNNDGRFVESGRLYYKLLQSGLQDGTTLTAYTLITFLEYKSLAKKYTSVVTKGTNFIASQYNSFGNSYDLALVAYVLQLADHTKKHYFFDKLVELSQSNEDGTLRWWGSGSTSIETTAYALMTYMNRGSYIDAKPIMKWLVSQRYDKGGYDNTQNTFVGLQALGQYSRIMSLSNQNYDVFVNYDSKNHRLHMDSTTSLTGHRLTVPSHVRQIEVKVEGTGAGVIQIAHKYNNIAIDSLPRFNITKLLSKKSSSDVLYMTIGASYQPKRQFEETNMVLIEVLFPSGYVVTNNVLKEITNNKKVRRAETEDGDTRLILYFDPLQPNKPVSVNVEAFRRATVLNQAPGWIKVYDYYDTTREAIEYFDIP